ncbi:CDP-diacylglycerol pyrophosphatase [Komagataeibacter rhaeticus DSM 16663]|nr:CDP-diacylglycerol pyrophosphatase [Komagataeibacter rhaeticus DSM 16663]
MPIMAGALVVGERMKRMGVVAGLVLAHIVAGSVPAHADPDVLWHIVHERCDVPPGAAHAGIPCEETDPHAGYAVLKDREGATQYLLIPTRRVTGMEDPAIIRDDAPDYLAHAWRQTARVNRRLPRPLPPEDLSLAINSLYGRSQNQLHVHVDCIRPDVKVALHWALPRLGPGWVTLPLDGHPYRARLLASSSLSGVRPLGMLAREMADPAHEMGFHTLVIAGIVLAGGQQGFVMLDDRADPHAGDRASGEDLQDHTCQIQHFP